MDRSQSGEYLFRDAEIPACTFL